MSERRLTAEQEMLFKRLIEYAHRQAMMRNGQIAQDIRQVLSDAARYWFLRDHSSPERCLYYLASDQTQARFNNPGAVDKHITTDISNFEARNRATKA